ncbi:MAG: hypothetical protein WC276_03495 [Sedimentibacter sp.]|jgi:hypothetical protein
MIIKNRHGNTSVNTAVSLKKGDFNTPYESQFFEKKKGGRNVVFQTAATSQNQYRCIATVLCLGAIF